ncbi:hypothetical protein HS088_TW21G00235 [Tripterygium wilfordii]|uniref:Uncharacterized protein n=1 Tax=Tripterygium wilfordii TaxID=458696 RepID=A0A7J7C1U3_TRIWF|nr:uncharacterized protein LOC119989735 [Tripterygium wilfordii]KAF5728092.1 hypothetical protein HS088_TW21G00235 [Tripterygium wilfordii]
MASACVNNIGVSPENFPPAPKYSSYGWLSPRISFSREEDSSKSKPGSDPCSGSDPTELSDPGDFEFCLGDDPVAMLPADELFADGKLMPLQLSSTLTGTTNISSYKSSLPEIRSPETVKSISVTDPYLFSPKAPRCSSRWRDLLGLKKLYQNQTQSTKAESQKTAGILSSNTNANSSTAKSLKLLLHKSSKSTSNVHMSASLDASLSLPLLKDTDSESVSISSSRLSLSSSSSSHDHDDLPRLSLDSDKPNPGPSSNPFLRNPNPPRMRLVKARADNVTSSNSGCNTGRSPMRRPVNTGESGRGVSVDSPRMNSSGKVVFQSLERSSSSPSSFNGGPRFKHKGMERSYSANVRVTPILNVPVCTLRGSSKSGSVFGFGQLFSSSPQKREGNVGGGRNRNQ